MSGAESLLHIKIMKSKGERGMTKNFRIAATVPTVDGGAMLFKEINVIDFPMV